MIDEYGREPSLEERTSEEIDIRSDKGKELLERVNKSENFEDKRASSIALSTSEPPSRGLAEDPLSAGTVVTPTEEEFEAGSLGELVDTPLLETAGANSLGINPEDITYKESDYIDSGLPSDGGHSTTDVNTKKNGKGQILAIKTGGNVEPEDIEMVNSSNNMKFLAENVYQNRVTEIRSEVQDSFKKYFNDGAAGVESTAEAYETTQVDIDERQKSPTRVENTYVDSIATVPPSAEEEITMQSSMEKETELNVAISNDLAAMSDSMGVLEMAGNFIGPVLTPFGYMLDEKDLLNSKVIQDMFDNPVDSLEKMVYAWHELPVSRRMLYRDRLREEILVATGTSFFGIEVSKENKVRAAQFLDLFMGHDGVDRATLERRWEGAFSMFDVVDLGPMILGSIIGVTRKYLRGNHIARNAEEVGNRPLASELTTDSVVSDDSARLGGTTQHDAANDASPTYVVPDIEPEGLTSSSPEVQQGLNNLHRIVNNTLRTFSEDSDRLKLNAFHKPERDGRYVTELQRLEDSLLEDSLLEDGMYLRKLKVEDLDGTTSSLSYEVVDRATGKVTDTVMDGLRVKWTLDHVTGTYSETLLNIRQNPLISEGSRTFISPSFVARRSADGEPIAVDFLTSMKSASVLDDLGALDQALVNNVYREATVHYRGLNRAGRTRVDNALLAGDEFRDPLTGEVGRDFSLAELQAGMSSGGISFEGLRTTQELQAIMSARYLSDFTFAMQNKATRTQFDLQGIKSITGLRLDPEAPVQHSLAKVLKTPESALTSDVTATGVRILDRSDMTMKGYSKELIHTAYDNGFQLVRLLEPTDVTNLTNTTGKTQLVNYILVHQDDIKGLPQTVIYRKRGYVPKVNEGVEFLVKERVVHGSLNGNNEHGSFRTLHFSSNRGDAQKRVDDLMEADRQAIMVDDSLSDKVREAELEKLKDKYSVLEDRELTHEQRLLEAQKYSGGPYTKARASHDITYGNRGLKADRLSPMEAYQRQLNQVAPYYSRNEWRLGEQQRWLNSAKAQGIDVRGFHDTVIPEGHPDMGGLTLLRNQIKVWSNVPSHQEKMWGSSMQRIHDWTLNGARMVPGLRNKESIKSVLWLKQRDPYSAMKAVTFHTLLGMYNPIQLYVQGQGAVVALSRYPETGAQAVQYALRMGAADNMQDPLALGENLVRMSEGGNSMLKELHQQWRRSGFYDSVRTNADINVMQSGLGNSMSAYKRLLENGLVMYRMGELFNRRVSFTQSYMQWKKLNPNSLPTDDDMLHIMGDAKTSMLELNRANAARLQGGPDANFFEKIGSVMFQFGQVFFKSSELVIKKGSQRDGQFSDGFTNQQKARILIGQMAMFGTIGIPFTDVLLDGVLGSSGITREELSPEFLSAWDGGASEVILRHAFGADNDVSTRSSVANNIKSFLLDIVDGSEGIGWEAIGAFGSVGKRSWDLLSLGAFPILDTAMDKGEKLTEEDFTTFGNLLAGVPSSSRQLLAGLLMMNEHKILTRRGDTLVNKGGEGGFSPGTIIMQAAGLQASDIRRAYEYMGDNQDYDKQIKAAADMYSHLLHLSTHGSSGGDGTYPTKRGLERADRMLRLMIPESLHSKVREMVHTRRSNPESLIDRESNKWIQRNVIDPLTGIFMMPLEQSLARSLETSTTQLQPIGQQQNMSTKEQP